MQISNPVHTFCHWQLWIHHRKPLSFSTGSKPAEQGIDFSSVSRLTEIKRHKDWWTLRCQTN